MAFKCSVVFALCLYAVVVTLALVVAIAVGAHSSGPLSCPCHWNNITHWVYATCLAHRTRQTKKKEKKLSVQREKMREELMQEQVLVAPPEPGPAAQQPRQILGPAQPEIVVELGGGQGA